MFFCLCIKCKYITFHWHCSAQKKEIIRFTYLVGQFNFILFYQILCHFLLKNDKFLYIDGRPSQLIGFSSSFCYFDESKAIPKFSFCLLLVQVHVTFLTCSYCVPISFLVEPICSYKLFSGVDLIIHSRQGKRK